MKDFRIRKKVKFCVLILIISCLAACGDATAEVEAIKKPQEKIEDLEVILLNLNYRSEEQNVTVDFETNIPESTEVNFVLYSPEFEYLISKSKLLGEERRGEEVKFEIPTDLLEKITGGEYYLKANVTVDEDNGKNNHMFTEELGGYGDELSERYKDSQNVIVESDENYNNTNFILSIETNKLMLAEGAIMDSIELETAEEEIVIENYSPNFLEYNMMYYSAFKKHLDLIGSNFEILAMDGYGNQNIVDDLIRWTNEFNELLDIYEVNSIPVNEVDEELYSHTIEMVKYQKEANEFIIKGLVEKDDLSFLIAEEYLYTISDMYMEGYNMLD